MWSSQATSASTDQFIFKKKNEYINEYIFKKNEYINVIIYNFAFNFYSCQNEISIYSTFLHWDKYLVSNNNNTMNKEEIPTVGIYIICNVCLWNKRKYVRYRSSLLYCSFDAGEFRKETRKREVQLSHKYKNVYEKI